MTIAWQLFTPWQSLIGGILIGLAVSLLLIMNGRIAGISGIVGGILKPVAIDIGWRIAFLGGIVIAPLLYSLVQPLPSIAIFSSPWQLIIAGLLVGFGSRLGSGCTSGHGVCGLSRFSLRSLVATLTFMAAGFITVFIIRHVIGG